MTIDQMNRLLREHIPLCGFMQLEITSLDENSIETAAPLEPNRNMHGTGFAGAQYSLAVATGWALVHNRLSLTDLEGQLVVKEATIHYRKPVTEDIKLYADFDNEISNDELLSELKMKGKIKFPLIVSIFSRDEKCGYLEAEYVVVVKR